MFKVVTDKHGNFKVVKTVGGKDYTYLTTSKESSAIEHMESLKNLYK